MAKRKVTPDAEVNNDLQYMICRCDAEFQVLDGEGKYDGEATQKLFYDHWNTECEYTHADEPIPNVGIASVAADEEVHTANPSADVQPE